ncbi:MAG: glycoside hydrolase family 97 protein [Prolixibacteraceae bacterium]|nr:glycoside hydrolase family 97 protein [Prolixibacteraceae bacterium]
MKQITFFLLMLLLAVSVNAKEFKLQSPNGTIELTVNIDDEIWWQATLNGNMAIEKAVVAMQLTDRTIGEKPKLKKNSIQEINETITPAVPHKNSVITDHCNELTLQFRSGYTLYFRAYNDGVAYRFSESSGKAYQVVNEQMDVHFPAGSGSFFPQEESMYSHNERFYPYKKLADISEADFCSLPVMFDIPNTAKVLFTETALHNYPGMFLKGKGETGMQTQFPKFVLEAVPNKDDSPDRNQLITQKADYIAQVNGARNFPWRVFIISNNDRTFVESNLTYQLSEPTVIENTGWIKPGKVAWDWYNANNIYGVDFKAGLNTETYKYYIDFASENNIEYVILDEGWTKSTTEILENNPDIDVRQLIDYGKRKNVDIILWVLWKPLDENMTEILETYKKWGAKGIKVDFMQRNDQYMVESYEAIARECARLELLVNFHGAFKPSGLRRKYPNVVNYEGVKGNENNKWSDEITPEHNVTIPFTRMAAGPMDYTPGAMLNADSINHKISFTRPMSLGTRCHELAMYVVYEAPMQMMCESPSTYKKEQETVDFITRIPTVWDETRVLHCVVADYIVVARRKGNAWYIGAMTDWTARELSIDLSFLDEGKYTMTVMKDGVNADRFAQDYKKEQIEVKSTDTIPVKMFSGGGWIAILEK